METISVIVPVYNAEKYLSQCIESILNQTYRDFELLLINDGSTDGSLEICERYRAQDERVRVISQENRGVSVARNRGIERSLGNYLCFVDADDLVHPKYLEILLGGIRAMNAELSVCAYCRFENGASLNFEEAHTAYERLERRQALVLLNQWRTPEALEMVIPCNKMYHRSIFSDLRFPEGVRHEDEFIAHKILNRCKAIVKNESALYLYRANDESYMKDPMSFDHLILFRALAERIAFYDTHAPELVCGAVHHVLRECNSFYDEYLNYSDAVHREKRKWLVQAYRKEYVRYFCKMDHRERLKGALFILLPKAYHLLAEKKWKAQENS